MITFAKLFTYTNHQILVTKDLHPKTDAPRVTIRTEHDGLDVSTALDFPDTERGYDVRDEAFDAITEDSADKMRSKLISELGLGGAG